MTDETQVAGPSIGDMVAQRLERQEAAQEHFSRSMPVGQTPFETLPLEMLVESPTNPRKNFDNLEELTANVKSEGILSPLLVRSLAEGKYEIVFGHRRFRAAKAAGLSVVPVDVRPLTDVQVLEAQVTENVQRRNLHPLEEAEAYQRLIDAAGYTAEMVAKKVGRTKSWVYQHLKLLSLCTEAQKAFLEGKLQLSVAIPLARVPTAKLQVKALDKLVGSELPAKAAIEWLQHEFCIPLRKAPFDRKDDMLVEGATACSVCPKRSGSGDPGLFDDLDGQDICTDTVCYQAKARATWEAKAEKFAKQDAQVLTLQEGKKLFRDGQLQYGTEYVDVDQPVHEDAKKRTWRQILEKAETPPRLVVAPDDTMAVHKLYRLEDATKAAAELELPWAKKQAVKAEKKKPEARAEEDAARTVRSKVALETLVGAGVKMKEAKDVPPVVFALLAKATEATLGHTDAPKAYLERLKVTDFEKWVGRASPNALLGYVFVAHLEESCCSVWDGWDGNLEAVAKAFGFDLRSMAKGVIAQLDLKKK